MRERHGALSAGSETQCGGGNTRLHATTIEEAGAGGRARVRVRVSGSERQGKRALH